MNKKFSIHLLPPFSYPACDWAQQVTGIIAASGLDIKTDPVSSIILPMLLSKIPNKLSSILPQKATLQNILIFLSKYDNPKTPTINILGEAITEPQKPSIVFSHISQKLRLSMHADTPPDTISELAWGRVFRQLPPTLQPLVALLGVTRYPSNDNFDALDTAWESVASFAGQQSLVAKAEPTTSSSDAVLERIIKRLDSLELAVTDNACQTLKNNSNYNHNNKFNNSNSNLCFFHKRYGHNAQKCVPPCNWHRLNR